MEIGDAPGGGTLQPEMVGGQVEVAGAARDAQALFDAVEKLVLAQLLAHLAVQGVHAVDQLVEFVEQRAETGAIDAGRVLQRGEGAHLPFELYHHLGLEIGAVEDGENVEQADERIAAVPHRRPFEVSEEFLEQMFQPQESANSFVERLFVNDVLLHESLCDWGWGRVARRTRMTSRRGPAVRVFGPVATVGARVAP